MIIHDTTSFAISGPLAISLQYMITFINTTSERLIYRV